MRKFVFTLCAAIFSATSLQAADNGRITVTTRGNGSDVILIPGLMSSAAVWNGLTAKLEAKHRVHLVQIGGFAGAPAGANAKGPVIAPVVDAIHGYMADHHLQSAAVIGHSMGGLIGLMLTKEHPEDVNRLMVIEALPFFGAIPGAENVAAIEPRAAKMRDMLVAMPDEAFAKQEEGAAAALVKSPEGRKQMIAWAVASDRKVAAEAIYDDMITDVRPALAKLARPVTVVYAWDQSLQMPKEKADALYQSNYAALPHKTLKRIDGSYHFVMLDQPAAFAAEVESFLK
jgi:pimeloyl-ACP methyl ester carboxylesterase